MTVKELIALLGQFRGDMEVICDRYSDLRFVQPDEITIVKAASMVSGRDGWLMETTHWKLKPQYADRDGTLVGQPIEIKEYVHFDGN